jgi:hypothetical protein
MWMCAAPTCARAARLDKAQRHAVVVRHQVQHPGVEASQRHDPASGPRWVCAPAVRLAVEH